VAPGITIGGAVAVFSLWAAGVCTTGMGGFVLVWLAREFWREKQRRAGGRLAG